MNAGELSTRLLIAEHEGEDSSSVIKQLSSISMDQLFSDLTNEDSRRAFWVNCYNAFTQILIKEKSPNLLSGKSRAAFFSSKNIVIADQFLSLNDIEHGMLRHSSLWWSRGYLKKFFTSDFEKKFRVSLDYRIHFALNCGANSCPVIRFYEPSKLDDQLDEAMKSFLSEEVEFNKRTKTVIASKIFDWYRGDFGGKKGVINLLWSQHLIPDNRRIKLRFRKYDWTVLLHKFNA